LLVVSYNASGTVVPCYVTASAVKPAVKIVKLAVKYFGLFGYPYVDFVLIMDH
jgi:hypothetical protein